MSHMFFVKGTPDDQQRRLGYHAPVVFSYPILPGDRLVVCDLQCVYFHSFPKIKGSNIPPRCVSAESHAGNGRSFRLSFSQALTCGSASHSTNLPKVSALGSLVITKPKSQLPVILFLGMLAAEGMLDA